MDEEDLNYYIPYKLFRVFSLFRQLLSHIRINLLPLSITVTLEIYKELKDMYEALTNMITALFNSGAGSLKAIGGAWTFGPMLLIALFAIIGNKGIEQLRHFSMVSLIGFTFACFNIFLDVSYYMLLVQIATIGFYILLAFLSKKRNWRFILDIIFSGLSLLFMIYMGKADFAAIAFMLVGGIGMGVIALYVFFALFTCCYKKICCKTIHYVEPEPVLTIINRVKSENRGFEYTDVNKVATQQVHYFFWSVLSLGCAFCVGAGVIVGLINVFDKESDNSSSLLFVYILIPLGAGLFIIFISIHCGDKCCASCCGGKHEQRSKRRGMVTRYTIKIVYIILDVLNIPLMKSVVEAFYDKTIQVSAVAQFGILSCFAQFVAIPIIYVISMRETIKLLEIAQENSPLNKESQWMKNCEHIPSSTIANFEIYKYKYRYWFFIGMFYDLINSLLSVLYERTEKIYYAVFVIHVIMLVAYCIFRPSFYFVHNVVNITSYVMQIVEDINILININGKPALMDKLPFVIFIMALPALSWIVSTFGKLYELCRSDKTEITDGEEKSYRCLGILLDDKAVDIISIWALHVMGCGVGLIMISIPVDMGMPNSKVWLGFGITETIVFCVLWVLSFWKFSSASITRQNDTKPSFNDKDDEKVDTPTLSGSHNL
ncbi:hypothetical protein TRFO_09401 [Tritrichomonas foetus]|uniref:Uncharacterized protein n=1 Tax=Tritrichomonas foetus TaxID=1144522 RepID=A0A1J4JJK0_9EUKA|nr:hypothetical protein TRFO_09401 [Tritrichomonas foetus]|eukprot:OHS97420.1 hypothetical protein TRFO_09401 [Tritrichomonas foetus]